MTEPILSLGQQKSHARGKNGMCDVEFWDSSFPELHEIIHSTDAVQVIRDLVMQVK